MKEKSFLTGMKPGDVSATSTVGRNIRFKGDVVGAEDLYVEGVIEGTISMGGHNLSIGSEGQVLADIYAQNVLINGQLEGDVFAEDLIEICKTARVTGSLTAPRIKLEDGGKFRGDMDMVSSDVEKRELFDEFKAKLGENEEAAAQAAEASNSYAPQAMEPVIDLESTELAEAVE